MAMATDEFPAFQLVFLIFDNPRSCSTYATYNPCKASFEANICMARGGKWNGNKCI
jgi:hypothetical protein